MTTTDLNTLTLSALASHYNSLAEPAGLPGVARFSDKTAALRRIERLWAQLTNAPEAEAYSPPPPVAVTVAEPVQPTVETPAAPAEPVTVAPAVVQPVAAPTNQAKRGRGRPSTLWAKDDIIELLVTDNPKRAGTQAHASFALYVHNMTVAAYLAKGGRAADLVWDQAHGFIRLGHSDEALTNM